MSAAVLSAVLLASCGKEDGRGAPKALNGERQAASGAAPAQSGGRKEGSLRLIPENPTVATDIQAIYSGASTTATYRWLRNGATIEGETGERLGRGNFAKGDEIEVIAMVNGSRLSCRADIGNSAPSVTKIMFSPERAGAGVDISASVEGKDPDAADRISFRYQWIINGQDAPGQIDPVLKGSLIKRGDTVALRVTPYDGTDEGAEMTSLPVTVENSAPRITSTPPREFSARTYTYQVTAEDPDGDEVVFSLAKSPAGMRIGAGGMIEWPLLQEYRGEYQVTVEADDGHGGKATQEFNITLGSSNGK